MGKKKSAPGSLAISLMLEQTPSHCRSSAYEHWLQKASAENHGISGDCLRGLERHVGDQRARRSFVEDYERLLLPCANHQISLPIAEAATLITMAGRISIDTWLGIVPRRSRPLWRFLRAF